MCLLNAKMTVNALNGKSTLSVASENLDRWLKVRMVKRREKVHPGAESE